MRNRRGLVTGKPETNPDENALPGYREWTARNIIECFA